MPPTTKASGTARTPTSVGITARAIVSAVSGSQRSWSPATVVPTVTTGTYGCPHEDAAPDGVEVGPNLQLDLGCVAQEGAPPGGWLGRVLVLTLRENR